MTASQDDRQPARRAHIRARGRLPAAAAIAAAAAAAGGAAALAAGGLPVGGAGAPDVRLVDDDGGQPLFQLQNLGPGESAERCLTVQNQGRLAARVALSGAVDGTGLSPFLAVRVQRGVRTAGGPFGSCDGFAAAGPPLFDASLAALPADAQAGALDPEILRPGASATYRVTATLADDNAAQGRTAGATFVFAAEGIPGTGVATVPAGTGTATVPVAPPAPPRAGTACTTVTLGPRTARTFAARTRTLRGTLTVRRVVRGRATRLRLTAALRVRGRSLPAARWRRATWTIAGRRAGVARRRPFAVIAAAGRFRVGTVTVRVAVRPRTGRTVTATFRLRVTGVRRGGAAVDCRVG